MARLTQRFFNRPALAVAPDLLGCRLIHDISPKTRLEGVIVEVEAYLGDGSDPASHSHGGPKPRAASMFGQPGCFYVYRSMGIHFCVNLVCAAAGRGDAVLLRAIEPQAGLRVMMRRRSGRSGREIAGGPGRLSQAFGIGLQHDGQSALSGPLRVEAARQSPGRIVSGPRIGISKAVKLPYRFCVSGSAWLSRPAPRG